MDVGLGGKSGIKNTVSMECGCVNNPDVGMVGNFVKDYAVRLGERFVTHHDGGLGGGFENHHAVGLGGGFVNHHAVGLEGVFVNPHSGGLGVRFSQYQAEPSVPAIDYHLAVGLVSDLPFHSSERLYLLFLASSSIDLFRTMVPLNTL